MQVISNNVTLGVRVIRAALVTASVPSSGHHVLLVLDKPVHDLSAEGFTIVAGGVIHQIQKMAGGGTHWELTFGKDWILIGDAVTVSYSGIAKVSEFSSVVATNNSIVTSRGKALVLRQRAFSMHFSMATFTIAGGAPSQQAAPNSSPNLFNPTGITSAASLDNWIAAAVAFGAKTVMLTAQHSDGFSLWDSASNTTRSLRNATTWWSANGFDIFGAFCTKVRAAGLKVGVYLSIWDSSWQANNAALKISDYTAWKAAYTAHKLAQFTEICTNYGTIDEMVVDAWAGIETYPGFRYPTYEEVVKATIVNQVRTLQPNCAFYINDYNQALLDSDINVYERGLGILVGMPPLNNPQPSRVWVTPTDTGDSWFDVVSYRTYQSPAFFLDLIATAHARNSDVMFNLSPDTTGLIDAGRIAFLASLNPTP